MIDPVPSPESDVPKTPLFPPSQHPSHLPQGTGGPEARGEAGAAGVTISGHGPALLAMSTDPAKAETAAAAMAQAFGAAGATVETLLCRHWVGSALPGEI